MKSIVIAAATALEVAPLFNKLNIENKEEAISYTLINNKLKVYVLISNVGQLAMAAELSHFLCKYPVNYCLNIGVAGTFNSKLQIGDVVQVAKEQLADLGAETPYEFIHHSNFSFMNNNAFPFVAACLYPYVNKNEEVFSKYTRMLPSVDALTVNRVGGTLATINYRKQQFKADIESMEGAAFFYVCNKWKLPCLQIRGISNRVEVRNTENWDIPLAVDNVNRFAWQLLVTLAQQ